MSRRRGSATALNASEVVAALAILLGNIHSYMGICQVQRGHRPRIIPLLQVELILPLCFLPNSITTCGVPTSGLFCEKWEFEGCAILVSAAFPADTGWGF